MWRRLFVLALCFLAVGVRAQSSNVINFNFEGMIPAPAPPPSPSPCLNLTEQLKEKLKEYAGVEYPGVNGFGPGITANFTGFNLAHLAMYWNEVELEENLKRRERITSRDGTTGLVPLTNTGGGAGSSSDGSWDGLAYFYWGSGYTGQSLAYPVPFGGESMGAGALTNDQYSSVRMPANAKATVFRDEKYGGPATQFQYDVASFEGNFDNTISSLLIEDYDAATNPLLWVFSDCNYQIGFAAAIPAGNYFSSDLSSETYVNGNTLGWVGNDAISSIIVPYNLTVYLYEDDFYQGKAITYSGPAQVPCFTDSSINFNDVTSSIYVIPSNQRFEVSGSWVQVGSNNGPISITIYEGTTSTSSDAHTTTFQNSFTLSSQTKMKFKVASETITLSDTISYTVAETITSTLTETYSQSCTVTCNLGGTSTAYVWQWQTTGTESDSQISTVYSCNYLCTNSFTSPACPLGYCADSFCTTCTVASLT